MRRAGDDKASHLAEEEPTIGDKMLSYQRKAMEQALETEIAAKTFGVGRYGEPGTGAGGMPGENYPASIVNSAFTQMKDMVHEANQLAKDKSSELKEARSDADEARAALFTAQLDEIKQVKADLVGALKRTQEQNSPEAAVAMVEKFDAAMSKIRPQPAQPPPQPSKGLSDETAIRLEQMHQQHELAMKTLEAEIARQNNSFQLKLLQFQEDINRQREEYKDSRDRKDNALAGFQDLAGAAAASIARERAGGAISEEPIKASISAFPCEFCKTHVPVAPGAPSATCPNPECKAEYTIHSR